MMMNLHVPGFKKKMTKIKKDTVVIYLKQAFLFEYCEASSIKLVIFLTMRQQ